MIEKILSYRQKDGIIKTPIDSLEFYTYINDTQLKPVMYDPCLCVVLQQKKQIIVGDKTHDFIPSEYLLASIRMPAHVKVLGACEETPYVSLKISFTMGEILDVLKECKIKQSNQQFNYEEGLCFLPTTQKLLSSIERFIDLIEEPNSIEFLAPLIKKEILFYAINDKGGEFLKQYIFDGSIVAQTIKIIEEISQNFTDQINMKELAKSFSISESSLYHSFKKMTTMSPLQYQKNLRLQKAQELLLSQRANIQDVAFDVGYDSPSQFSREYSRMFGVSPKAHIKSYLSL